MSRNLRTPNLKTNSGIQYVAKNNKHVSAYINKQLLPKKKGGGGGSGR